LLLYSLSVKNHVLLIAKRSTLQSADPHIVQQFITLVTLKAQIDAYHTVFYLASLLVFIGALLAWWIAVPNERLDAKVHAE